MDIQAITALIVALMPIIVQVVRLLDKRIDWKQSPLRTPAAVMIRL